MAAARLFRLFDRLRDREGQPAPTRDRAGKSHKFTIPEDEVPR